MQVIGSSENGMQAFVETLAKRLSARIAAVEAGQIQGPPVTLPPKPRLGPPPGGPNLEALALGTVRLGGGTVTSQGYTNDTAFGPVSEYQRDFTPAGVFAGVEQRILQLSSLQEAMTEFTAFTRVFGSAQLLEQWGGLGGHGIASYSPKAFSLHVGDQSAVIEAAMQLTSGSKLDEGTVLLRVGSTLEVIIVATLPAPGLPAKLDQLAAIAAGLVEHKPVGTMTSVTSPVGNPAALKLVLQAERRTGSAKNLAFTMNMKYDVGSVKESIAASGLELLPLHEASLNMSVSVPGLEAQRVRTLSIGTKTYVQLSAFSTPQAQARVIKLGIVENVKASLGLDPWSLSGLKTLKAIRDVLPAGPVPTMEFR